MIDFSELIARGREETYLEYKEDQPWSTLKSAIVKTCLGLANLRGGGYIVVGMSQREGVFQPTGMAMDHVLSYDEEEIRAQVNRYAEPFVDVRVDRHETDGKIFVVVTVQEFAEVPVICRRDGDGLRRGALYTRSRRQPETTLVDRPTDLRELLDLAVEKRLERLLQTFARAGVPLTDITVADSERRFNEELGGL